MRVVTVDVGGSGVKTAIFLDGRLVAPPQTTSHAEVDLARLAPWLRTRVAGTVDAVAVAVPGMIAADGRRTRF